MTTDLNIRFDDYVMFKRAAYADSVITKDEAAGLQQRLDAVKQAGADERLLKFLDGYLPPAEKSNGNSEVKKFVGSKTYRREPSPEDVLSGKATIGRGQGGAQVLELQKRLNAEGVKPPLSEDGLFGPKTEAALRNYQRENGLSADGVYNLKTKAMLDAPSGKTIDSLPGLSADSKLEAKNALAAAKTPEGRKAISELVSSEGFGKLDKFHQGLALGAIQRAPSEPALAKSIKEMINSASFQSLGDDAKGRLLNEIGARSGDKSAVDSLARLGSSQALPKLGEADMKKLISASSGASDRARTVRAELDKMMTGEAFAKGTPEQQLQMLRDFVGRINEKEEISNPTVVLPPQKQQTQNEQPERTKPLKTQSTKPNTVPVKTRSQVVKRRPIVVEQPVPKKQPEQIPVQDLVVVSHKRPQQQQQQQPQPQKSMSDSLGITDPASRAKIG